MTTPAFPLFFLRELPFFHFGFGAGALSGGAANIALRSTETIINYPPTTFLRSFHTPTQQIVNNQMRTYTSAPSLAIKGSAFAGSHVANG